MGACLPQVAACPRVRQSANAAIHANGKRETLVPEVVGKTPSPVWLGVANLRLILAALCLSVHENHLAVRRVHQVLPCIGVGACSLVHPRLVLGIYRVYP